MASLRVLLPAWFAGPKFADRLAITNGELTAACSAEGVVFCECVNDDYSGYFNPKDLTYLKG